MPHVVLTGDLSVADCASAYAPIMHRSDDGVLKTATAYVANDGKSMLVDALAIEVGNKQAFYALVSDRDDGIVVRLDPMMDPEKTDGVKRILALLAMQFRDATGSDVGKTNLEAFLS